MEREIERIKEILKGRFAVESERAYWENRLSELQIKAETFKQNKIYRNKNIRYDR